MTLTTGDLYNNMQLNPKQYVRANGDATAFEVCTVYDQPDWNQTDSGAMDFIKNKPTIPTVPSRSFANPTRSLNTAFQISSTRDAMVSYGVDIAATLTLTGGATGTLFLEYADNSGFTTNVVTVNNTANGNTGTLTVGLSLTQTATATVCGVIPASKYVRLRTANTTGTPTFTWRSGQEVLL